MAQEPEKQKDFFISYTGKDSTWAEWIAFELEAAGYSTMIQAWDIRPGSNFVAMMNDATKGTERTIAVLSTAYLESEFGFSEWAAAFRRDPKGKHGRVLPIRIEKCDVEGLLGPIVYIDLVNQEEQQARERLLAGVKPERAKPLHVAFPTPTSRASGTLPTLERPVFPGSLPPIWNVPYPRNPLFTGREELLTQLTTSLHTGEPTLVSQPPKKDTQPQAISGLGGIGKTQLALEYAYRDRGEYQAVLWAQADTKETLTSSYLELATLLNLPEKDAQESTQVIVAIKQWLQRSTGYLLILDNADDLALAREFLPPICGGQVLLTTRAQSTGRFAQRVEVDVLPMEQGIEFLLRRAGLLSPNVPLEQANGQDKHIAQEIYEELGGLPLALDQAGAYIEETGCGLATYAKRYQHQRNKLLAQRRGKLVDDHPLPVATTWKLSFEQVEQRSPAGADLLRVCAFLAPDAIPESIITQGASYLGPHLAVLETDNTVLDEALEALLAYSLVKRDTTNQTLSVHRLVQAVLKDQMEGENKKEWAKRTVLAVNAAFPYIEHKNWPQCEQLLPHALVCSQLIEQYQVYTSDTADLLNQTGFYLQGRARYQEAEQLLKLALTIKGEQMGTMHPSTAQSLNNLASLYQIQSKYEQAEPLYERALTICEQQLGAMHPSTATSLDNLASLYLRQGKYAEAEMLVKRALAIYEQTLGSRHPDTATSLDNLASLYKTQGKYREAEPLYTRALAIREQQLGAMHPDTAQSLNNLAELYRVQGKYVEAEPLYTRALAIREQQLGAMHPDTAQSLNNLALLYHNQGKYTEAEPLYQRALAIDEQVYGPEHPEIATDLNNLASLYNNQEKYEQAEPLFERALAIREEQLGAMHPDTATSLNNLALLYYNQGKYAQAELLFKRALAIYEEQLGAEHPNTKVVRGNFDSLLEKMKRG